MGLIIFIYDVIIEDFEKEFCPLGGTTVEKENILIKRYLEKRHSKVGLL